MLVAIWSRAPARTTFSRAGSLGIAYCLLIQAWHNFFFNSVMEDKKNMVNNENDRKSDDKCTAGALPDKPELFEDTTWVKKADHGESATEAERKNVSKTLPDTAAKEKSSKQ